MGHRHGNSKQMDDAVVAMDKQIQRIWEAVQYREKNFNEEWQIWITTDHGREENGYHHGGQSERERTTWIVANAKQLNEKFLKQQAGITDIMPSIASFLNISIPKENLMEIDGVSLTGKISAADAKAIISKGVIEVKWNVINKEGKAKVWLATTNNFKAGGKDEYKLITEVPVSDGSAKIEIGQNPSDFHKVVIEMPYNILNAWAVKK
jgi:arylsulfatase A-like enzyme